jgi:hypothetical protein
MTNWKRISALLDDTFGFEAKRSCSLNVVDHMFKDRLSLPIGRLRSFRDVRSTGSLNRADRGVQERAARARDVRRVNIGRLRICFRWRLRRLSMPLPYVHADLAGRPN